MNAVLRFVVENSLLLLLGAAIALAWANLSRESYDAIAHALHFWVNDLAMALFFGVAAKEVVEAMLPGGPLNSPRQAAVPLVAAIGGMVVPATLYVAAVLAIGRPDLMNGWAIPCATDIAFSYLVARLIFPAGHPAIPFLLLLAIADDAMGLLILAVFYPTGDLSLLSFVVWFLPALLVAWLLRRRNVHSFWPYIAGAGALSWTALYLGGLHPALALVPIVPFMPHGPRDDGVLEGLDGRRHDTLNAFEHWAKVPVQIVLFLFGIGNAGVALASVGMLSGIITAALLFGKPVGVLVSVWVAERLGFRRSAGLTYADLTTVGLAAAIGFTVALFFATAAFPAGPALDEAKMGALLSFFAAPLALIAGWLMARNAPSPRAQ